MLPDGIERVLLTEEQITSRVRHLAEQISNDYRGRVLLLVGVLNGSFVFLADLARLLSIPAEIDFVSFSSYASSSTSDGCVDTRLAISCDVIGKDVLIVEDIIDTGHTISRSGIVDRLRLSGASSVKLCSLLDKAAGRKADVTIDYLGFTIPDQFVVGYGMDYAGLYRYLPYVAILRI